MIFQCIRCLNNGLICLKCFVNDGDDYRFAAHYALLGIGQGVHNQMRFI